MTLACNTQGDMTDDGQTYTYVYDAFGRLRQVYAKTHNTPLVSEYRYNNDSLRGGKGDATRMVEGKVGTGKVGMSRLVLGSRSPTTCPQVHRHCVPHSGHTFTFGPSKWWQAWHATPRRSSSLMR